ncbi:MAG: hypothetical protein ACE5ID_11660, partial [Acidobacteriota bacterium]
WQPLIQGGVQEGGQRAGRLHPALVAALGLTAAAASRHLVARARAAEQLRKDLLEACSRRISGLMTPFQGADRLPGHLLMMIPGVEGESLLADLRRDGIEADSGSSCMDGPGVTSRVLRASGLSQDEARSSLILRLSSSLSRGVVEAVAGSLATSVARLRALAP